MRVTRPGHMPSNKWGWHLGGHMRAMSERAGIWVQRIVQSCVQASSIC